MDRSSFPTPGVCSGAPFPPPGPVGSVPRLPRYYGALRFLSTHPPASLCSARGTAPRGLVRSGRRRPRSRLLSLVRITAGPTRWFHEAEAGRPPRFLGNPCPRAPLFDPGRTARPTTRRADFVFRSYQSVDSYNLVFRGSITRPAHSLCRFASPVTRRDATLGSGRWSTFPVRGSHPPGCTEDF